MNVSEYCGYEHLRAENVKVTTVRGRVATRRTSANAAEVLPRADHALAVDGGGYVVGLRYQAQVGP